MVSRSDLGREGRRALASPLVVMGCIVAATVGVSGLLGWALGIPLLKQVVGGYPAIVPNTTIALLLGAASLASTVLAPPSRAWRLLGRSLGAAMAAVGLVTLFEYLVRRDLIDTLLFARALAGERVHPGRPAPNTALCIALLGFALLSLQARGRWRRLRDPFAAACAVISFGTVTGYAYGTSELLTVRSLLPGSGMAIQTSLALLALSMGALSAPPVRGLAAAVASRRAGGAMARKLLPWAVAAPLLFGLLAAIFMRGGVTPATALAALVVALIAFLTALLLWVAGPLDRNQERQERVTAERESLLARLDTEERERARFRAVLDQLPEGIILLDPEGRVLMHNAAALRYRSPARGSDASGNPLIYEVCLPTGEPLPWDRWPLARALRQRETVAAEQVAVRTGEGKLVPLLAAAAPIFDANGGFWGAAEAFHDISELKALERQREEWGAIVAHELRRPLSVLALASERLARLRAHDCRPEEEVVLERLRVAVGSLSRLVGDLSDMSRIDSGRMQVEPRPVELGPLVDETIERLRQTSSEEPEYAVAVEKGLPPVFADPGRVEQILANLLSNAAKYGSGGIEVAAALEREGDAIRISVSNAGRGIDPEDLPHVFERFYRSRNPQRGKPGLGVGLAIARGLVEAHGGRMWVESPPGAFRTTFFFTLPVALPGEATRASATAPGVPAPPGG